MAFRQILVRDDRGAGKAVNRLFGGGALFGVVQRGMDFARAVDQKTQFCRVHRVDDIGADAVARVGVVPFQNASAERHRGQRHFRPDRVIGKADDGVRESGFQITNPLQGYYFRRAWVKVGAFQQGVINPRPLQNCDRGAQRLDALHAG